MKCKLITAPSKYPGLLYGDKSEITDEDDNGDFQKNLPSSHKELAALISAFIDLLLTIFY